MKHALLAAGEALYEPWPGTPRRRIEYGELRPHAIHRMVAEPGPVRVGFFMPTASVLAHAINLLTFLQGLDQLEERMIQPIIYTFGEENPDFAKAFAGREIRYVRAECLIGYWQGLRAGAIADNIAAMVFVSVAQGLAFASSMGVAPKHIWWAHKWHGLQLPDLDGYIDACHPFHEGEIEIAGHTWQSTYTALPEMFDPVLTSQAQALRAGMSVATVFGWMGREDKITPHYIAAVIDILRAVPDSIYVYTGRRELDWVREVFAEAGLADRVAYLGWIPTRLWAQIIDIYLDTFPFQSGHCGYEAMAACKPVIWLHDDATAREQSASGLIKATWDRGAAEIFRGIEPWNDTVERYVASAVHLAGAEDRVTFGSAYRAWLERFMMDKKRMAQSVSAAILDVING